MSRLHISDPRERALVASADCLLGVSAALMRPFRRRQRPASPRRILLLRLERLGDLLMVLPAIADVRAAAPGAEIHLVVGSWNRDVACAIDGVTHVHTLDARWLARGETGVGAAALVHQARAWRSERYDLAVNFEPDIRSNMAAAASGAAWTAGYRSGGGGALLDLALDYDQRAHTTDNARRLIASVFRMAVPAESRPTLVVPAAAHENASWRLAGVGGPLIGMHVSGGRAIKQWDSDRFAAVARRLIEQTNATIVMTGAGADRPLVESVKIHLPADRVVDVAGHLDLLTLAAMLERMDVLITGDTGPMHLAVAVGTPVVAVFGPSDPARYGPRGPHDRVVRVDLPCSPCNRIRLPPARCAGHIPDCLALVSVDRVLAAAMSVLDCETRQHSSTA